MRHGIYAALLGLCACTALPVPEAYQPVPVSVVHVQKPATPRQASSLEVFYSEPKRPYRTLARLHAEGSPGTHVRYVYGEMKDHALAIGADALVITETREKVQPPLDSPIAPGRPSAVVGGVLYEVEATAIEFISG